jgi:DNA repair exonuclease SbcCD nuclease subunit
MSRGVTFLHLADLHLGLRVTRFESDVVNRLREARFQSLENALQVAETRGVDFLLIAGDLFDDNAVSAVDAQRAFDMLKGRPTPVYVLPGNHDPYCSGSLWQRPPWSNAEGTALRVLTRVEPVAAGDGVVLLPCPVVAKRATLDPTHWIEPGETTAIRLGLAHGSLMDRAFLPLDDHPIPLDAPARGGLDYLALGHWHSQKLQRGADGAVRAAYPGTSEPMGFGAGFDIGWSAYAADPGRADFAGSGQGAALLVHVAGPGASPIVESMPIGRYTWAQEEVEVTDETFAEVFSELATRPDLDRRLLRLSLKGVLSVESMVRLDGFRDMLKRYLYCELDEGGLHVRPDSEKIAEVVGSGLLREVWRRIETQAEGEEPEARRIAERARLLLYQLAQEAQS